MKKQVSEAQIEQLFQFLRQKYVRYYDVQIELVDHFASAIEAMWEENPSMTFQQGIDRVYGEFPITGFSNLITEKSQGIQNRIKKHTWKAVKAYLTIPKISLTILLCVIFNIIYSTVPYPHWVAYGIITVTSSLSFIALKKNIRQQTKTKFLVLELLIGSQSLFSLSQYFPIYGMHNEQFPDWANLLFSIITVLAILVAYGHHQVSNTILEEWKQQFSQFI